jgi:hypothetical protein
MANTIIMVNESMIILMTMMMVWPFVLIADPYQIHDDVTTANDHYNDGGMGTDSDIRSLRILSLPWPIPLSWPMIITMMISAAIAIDYNDDDDDDDDVGVGTDVMAIGHSNGDGHDGH